MSDDRFKPPAAAVADVLGAPGPSKSVRLALALATLLQLILYLIGPLVAFIDMASIGAVSPIGFVAFAGGLASLYIGVGMLVVTRTRGARVLAASLVLQLLAFALWHHIYLVPWGAYRLIEFVLPMLMGWAIAVWGWIAAPARQGAAADSILSSGEPA